jgi:hypothetical protein
MNKVSTLLEQAKIASGLDDFGDESYREGMDRLFASIEAEARLNAQGAAMIDAQIVDLLGWRLKVEHWYNLHPEIDEQEIVAPLFSFMLAEDPAVRCIRGWESSAPCPPPETATEHSDPRIEQQKVLMSHMDRMAPRLKQMLPSSPTQPMECQHYMAHDFKSQLFQAQLRIPSYVDWLNNEADLVPTYRYVKRVLKLLQWRCPPNRWRLKNPSHIVFITALDKVFPDARYWMTHRDVTRVIPSVVDLYQEISRAYTDRVDVAYIAKMNVEWTELGLHRMAAFRAAGNNARFYDVDFAEFQADPMPAIEGLYGFLGETLTDEARRRMIAWRENSPVDKHGRHQVDPAELGLDLDELKHRFAFYDHRQGATAPA